MYETSESRFRRVGIVDQLSPAGDETSLIDNEWLRVEEEGSKRRLGINGEVKR